MEKCDDTFSHSGLINGGLAEAVRAARDLK